MLAVVPGDGSGHEGGKDSSPSLIDAPHLVALVRTGAIFRGRVLAKRPEQAAA